MIPRKIHYIWLGGNKKTSLVNICINSWKEKLVDYELIEWNESNLNLDEIAEQNRFFRECRKRKLWAYMADYLRLLILYREGGIYMDTDVQVLKSFDPLLELHSFIGYEAKGYIGTGVIGAQKGSAAIKAFLDFYETDIWNCKLFTIPQVITTVMGRNSELPITVYPQSWFAPYDPYDEYHDSDIQAETICVHWFNAGWVTNPGVRNFLSVKHIHNPVLRTAVVILKNIKHVFRQAAGIVIGK